MAAAKKAASKKPAKKAAAKADEPEVVEPQEVADVASPDMEGEEYQVGYLGVSSDDEDHSMAAEVKRLSGSE
jgi:hypothetical protein